MSTEESMIKLPQILFGRGIVVAADDDWRKNALWYGLYKGSIYYSIRQLKRLNNCTGTLIWQLIHREEGGKLIYEYAIEVKSALYIYEFPFLEFTDNPPEFAAIRGALVYHLYGVGDDEETHFLNFLEKLNEAEKFHDNISNLISESASEDVISKSNEDDEEDVMNGPPHSGLND